MSRSHRPTRFARFALVTAGALIPVGALVPAGAMVPAPSMTSTSRSEAADTVDALIDRVLEAYGGAEAVRAVQSLRQEGLVVTESAQEHGTTVRIATCPDRLSLVVDYPSRSEIRILDRARSWQGPSPSRLTDTSGGPMHSAMTLQAARMCRPGTLDTFRSAARIESEFAMPGDVRARFGPLTVLGLDIAPDLRLRVWVSDETGLVLRSESLISMGAMTMTFASDYADYQSVDGVLFPFREEAFASGTHTATIRLDAVEVNPEGDRARLPVPGGQE
jgi:hypothetical protein